MWNIIFVVVFQVSDLLHTHLYFGVFYFTLSLLHSRFETIGRRRSRQQFSSCRTIPKVPENYQCWRLERPLIRRRPRDHNPDVEEDAESDEGDDDVYD